MAKQLYFLGVDGGATRCRARLRAADGAPLAEAEGPAANIYVDFDGALGVVRDLAQRVLARAGLSPADQGATALGVALAGVSGERDAARVVAALPGWARARAANDAAAACLGAHAGADGGLVIAGTGSAGIARVNGRERVIGGRGFLLGDDGSAARIGADALRAALRVHDGLEAATPLARALLARFGDDPVAMLDWALAAKPRDYGAFASPVIAAAGEGDALALRVVTAAALALGALARAVEALGATRVALAGGLAGAIRPYLTPDLAARLSEPLHDATDGAILFAGGVVPDGAQGRRRA